ncbi:MAG TPA: hypothetical protein VG078_05010 [Acidimicrobiales bacterium]|nr:hypothetical protein [Acidimicrobiales bacterium]
MADMQQSDMPGQPGTQEGETEHSEADPVAPSVQGRDTEDEGGGTG